MSNFFNKVNYKKEIKDLKSKIKSDKRLIKSLRDDIVSLKRESSRIQFNLEEDNRRQQVLHESEIAKVRAEMEEENRLIVANLEDEKLKAIRKAEKDRDDTIAQMREKHNANIDRIEDELAIAKGETEKAKVTVDLLGKKELSNSNEVERLKNIISDLIKKLPNVDMSKFNVNVDVPEPKVTINNK